MQPRTKTTSGSACPVLAGGKLKQLAVFELKPTPTPTYNEYSQYRCCVAGQPYRLPLFAALLSVRCWP